MRPARVQVVAMVAAVVVAGHAWVLQQAVQSSTPAVVSGATGLPLAAILRVRWIADPDVGRAIPLPPAGAALASLQRVSPPAPAAMTVEPAGTRSFRLESTQAMAARPHPRPGTDVPASAFARVAATTTRPTVLTPETTAATAEPPTARIDSPMATETATATARTPIAETSNAGAGSEPSTQVAQAATASAPHAEPTAEPAEVVDVPTYRTRPPASMHLSYQLRRGMLTGTGDFDWKTDGGSYEMRLDGKVAGFSVLSWVSKGGFDASGLAPLRYTDQRRNKQTLAANFQRGPGVITYSQPQTEHPLVPGAQDRLSWLIQLPSILSADASLGRAGAHVSMFVTGARGDADVWSFRVVAQEPVSTPGGTVDAVHLLREARKPHDTQVDVWLDPKRGYLPVHAQMANEGGGEAFELSLR